MDQHRIVAQILPLITCVSAWLHVYFMFLNSIKSVLRRIAAFLCLNCLTLFVLRLPDLSDQNDHSRKCLFSSGATYLFHMN